MITSATWSGKGGVCKTTTAVNLCAAAHHLGKRTVLVDQDKQGSNKAYIGQVPFEIRTNPNFEAADFDFCCIDYPAGYVQSVPAGINFIVVPLGNDRISYEGVEPYLPVINGRKCIYIATAVNGRYKRRIEEAHALLDLVGGGHITRFSEVVIEANNERTSIFDNKFNKSYNIKLHRSVYINIINQMFQENK